MALISFNPLAGIRCFLTQLQVDETGYFSVDSFNPLAGIRCFLTGRGWAAKGGLAETFQSPSGDSLFSDRVCTGAGFRSCNQFQSPSGDSLFSDEQSEKYIIKNDDEFQSPSGDSLFSDRRTKGYFADRLVPFQSPSGDSLFSDEGQIPPEFGKLKNVSIP